MTAKPRDSRWVGLLPLAFFALKAYEYRSPDVLPNLLWWCNISNLVLGVAMILRNARAIWICSLLLIAGTPIWLLDVAATGDFSLYSILTHCVSPVLGLRAVRGLAPVKAVWIQGMVYYALLMAAAFFFSPPALNINLAHDVYAAAKPYISNYTLYTAMNSSLLAGSLLVLEKIFKRILY